MEIRAPQNTNKAKIIAQKKQTNNKSPFAQEIFTDEIYTSSPSSLSSLINLIDPFFLNTNHQSNSEEKAILLGSEILDELEKLKLTIISDTKSNFSGLNNLLTNIQSYTNSEKAEQLPIQLHEILLEIETRTIVEIAKIKKNNR